jgi:proline dehydrogenase
MIRRVLLWSSTNRWMSTRLPRWGFVKRAVRRFMPGERPEDALGEAERLAGRGSPTIVTLLGENVELEAEAQATIDHYRRVIQDVARRGVDAEVSIKLTQLGLDLNPDLALRGVRTLVEDSARVRVRRADGTDAPLTLWIDMESSVYVDRTLDVYRAVRADHENVGVAIQAYLRRTPADIDSLLPLKPTIRLVKGAYLESEAIAFPEKRDVDRAFHTLMKRLLEDRRAGRVGRPSIATHDPRLIGEVTRMVHELGIAKHSFEFGMLYGIGTDRQQQLREQGYTVRVLISYGEAWFPWYMRRLAERPANLWFVVKQLGTR